MKQEVIDFAISKLNKALEDSIFDEIRQRGSASELWTLYALIEQARASLLLNLCNRGAIGNDSLLDTAETNWYKCLAVRQRRLHELKNQKRMIRFV